MLLIVIMYSSLRKFDLQLNLQKNFFLPKLFPVCFLMVQKCVEGRLRKKTSIDTTAMKFASLQKLQQQNCFS